MEEMASAFMRFTLEGRPHGMPSPQWATGAHEGGWWRSGALSCARPVNGVYRTRNGALQLRSFRLRRGRPHSSYTKPSRLARWRILSSNFMGREPRLPAMRSSQNPFHLAVTFSGSPSPSQRAIIDRKVQVSHLHRLWKPDDHIIIEGLAWSVNRWRPVRPCTDATHAPLGIVVPEQKTFWPAQSQLSGPVFQAPPRTT